jgi:hypothetical protein
MGTACFAGVKRPGCGVDDPPPSSAEVKDRVGLYLYSPSGVCGLSCGNMAVSMSSPQSQWNMKASTFTYVILYCGSFTDDQFRKTSVVHIEVRYCIRF